MCSEPFEYVTVDYRHFHASSFLPSPPLCVCHLIVIVTVIVTHTDAVPSDGLVRQGRALTLARAAVTAEVASAAALRLAGGVAGADAPLGPVVAALLCDPSRYRTSTSPCQSAIAPFAPSLLILIRRCMTFS